MHFADRLHAATRALGNPCLVGLDPHLDSIPPEFEAVHDPGATRAERARAMGDFLLEVVELAAGRVPAVKPQSAFFEQLGADGAAAWERVVAAARAAGLLVVGDVKRGDIGSTASAYARAFLEGLPGTDPATLCDAVTLNPFLGSDSIAPFLEVAERLGKGLYLLVRTSNPASGELQLAGEPSVSERVAELVARLGAPTRGASGLALVGAVVGATQPEELARLAGRMPAAPLLLPGYGAQGAGAREVAAAFAGGRRGVLVNSSRAILFAWRSRPGVPWKDASRAALDAMAAELGPLTGARA